VMKSY